MGTNFPVSVQPLADLERKTRIAARRIRILQASLPKIPKSSRERQRFLFDVDQQDEEQSGSDFQLAA